jgi:hypothetical protein
VDCKARGEVLLGFVRGQEFFNYLYLKEGDPLGMLNLYRTMVWELRILSLSVIYVLLVVLEINSCYFCVHY